jgi:hypothetical protein
MLIALSGAERSAAVQEAQARHWASRRILSPAEAINAITVGALHSEASQNAVGPYVFDPHDGAGGPSPVSGLGGGHRRAIKPEVDAPPIATSLVSVSASTLYGIQVASSNPGQEVRIAGTSPAAALVSRRLSDLVDLAEEVSGGTLPRHLRAVAAKAMLVHGAGHPESFGSGAIPLQFTIGYGSVDRDLREGCLPNEATVLFTGDIGALQARELLVPLPNGLGVRGLKRVTATVAWLSPVNWKHRQYRRAQLSFAKPTGFVDLPPARDVVDADAGRGSATVKHQVWEIDRAFAGGVGDALRLRVNCHEQAGGLNGTSIPFAAVVSLWVAPEIGIDVHAQVAQQIQPRVTVGQRG